MNWSCHWCQSKYRESYTTAISLNGCIDLVKKFIEAGVEVNLNDRDDTLLAACQNGHKDVVQKLIEEGAYFNVNDRENTF